MWVRMPTGTIELLRMPCSRTSGEYPLLSSATQSLASYTVKTVVGRYTEDLDQTIIVPVFDGWSTCNMVRINGLLYWILDSRTGTDTASSVRLEVTVCGPSSLLHKADRIRGIWSRTPTNTSTYLQHQAISSDMVTSRVIELPNLGLTPNSQQIFWCQVTATVSLSDTDLTPTQDQMTRYGFFFAWDANGYTTSVMCTSSGSVIGSARYPTMEELINDPESLGFQADTIIDISISARCPWEYTKTTGTLGGLSVSVMTLDAGLPQVVAKTGLDAVRFYRMDREWLINSAPEALFSDQTITLTELERVSGAVTIRSNDGSAIAVVPPSLGTSIPIQVQCYGDYGALYTRILLAGTYYTIPEGHAPWVGSAWESYRAYSMTYDRQAMEQAIDYANQRVALGIAEAGANAVSSVAMGAIGGTPLSIATGAISGAVSFGISTWAKLEEQRISESESRSTQALAERRVKAQAGTPYNTGYGLSYCDTVYHIGLQVQIDMPRGLTSAVESAYTLQFGYPAEGVATISMVQGYVQGRLLDSALTRGRLFDRANETIQKGLRFIEV